MLLKEAITIVAICLLASVGQTSFAQSNEPPLVDAPEPPTLPEPVRSGEVLEPDVTIVHGEKETVYEYRVNGELRAIKVVPDGAPAYYLVDGDGDGALDTQRHALAPDFLINSWVLFQW